MHNPVANIPQRKHEKKPRRIVPIGDILKVIMLAQGQDRVLLETYWHTAARKSEIFNLTWEDVNFERRSIRLCTRKTKDGNPVYDYLWMNDDLHKALKWQWTHRHKGSPYVFTHANPKYGERFVARYKFLKGLCRKAEVTPFGFHAIRHAVASYLNDIQKVGVRGVQKVLRHRSQKTTEIYLHDYTGTKEAMSLLEWKCVESTHKGTHKKRSGDQL